MAPQPAVRLKKQTLADQVVTYVRDLISQDLLQPGQRLTIQGLATDLGISMTPVREAIKTLEALRYVTVEVNKSIVVAKLDPAETLQHLIVYRRLEALAAELIAAQQNRELIARLRAAAEFTAELADRGDPVAFFHGNNDFHRLLVTASQNRPLIEFHQNLSGRLYSVRYKGMTQNSAIKKSAIDHLNIVAAIENGEAVSVGQLVEAHFNASDRLVQALAADDAASPPGGAAAAKVDAAAPGRAPADL